MDFTNISNVSPRVNQNENKKLCTFQRIFEIENISTNDNISVNENIVIMLLKKVYCRKLHASHFMCKFRFILLCIQTMSLIWSRYINYVVLLFCLYIILHFKLSNT